jgi:hypothetical protein
LKRWASVLHSYWCHHPAKRGNQPGCMSSNPTSYSFFPTYLTLWPQLFRWYPEIEEIELLPGTHERKI